MADFQVNNPFAGVLSIGGIAGLLAVFITASICIRYIFHGSEEIPQILTYSLSTIIGFYFGTGVAKPSTTTAAQPAPVAPVEPAA